MTVKAIYVLLFASVSVPFALAQGSSQKPVKGMASTVGLYVYPQNSRPPRSSLRTSNSAMTALRRRPVSIPTPLQLAARQRSRAVATTTQQRKEHCEAQRSPAL